MSSADVRADAAKPDVAKEINCLAKNIYFEARSEPIDGKLAVGHVVLNRVADTRYPTSICEVVRQGGEEPLNRCQFSWWCDGRSDKPKNARAWQQSLVLARVVFWGYSEDPTRGALWYHADYVKPVWRKVLPVGPKIGKHIFYLNDREVVAKGGQQKKTPGVRIMFDTRPVKANTTAKAT
jgi:spore germination cell wall hydrolase CwlJ-like protein